MKHFLVKWDQIISIQQTDEGNGWFSLHSIVLYEEVMMWVVVHPFEYSNLYLQLEFVFFKNIFNLPIQYGL